MIGCNYAGGKYDPTQNANQQVINHNVEKWKNYMYMVWSQITKLYSLRKWKHQRWIRSPLLMIWLSSCLPF